MPPSRCFIASRANAALALLFPGCMFLASCSTGGAPSFDLFGAFFPAWLLCSTIGLAGAIAARAVFVGTGLLSLLPFQLFVCTAIGVIVATLTWLLWFGW